jgi:hypothetical protein
MKVSIVIPVYNGEKYLEECIDSALNQSYSNIEVIAVNDGSTDNSLQILKNYSDRIKIISKENGGIASALNAGIKAMTGEWFKWLSADDILYPNAVDALISVSKGIKDKKHSILYANFDFIDSKGKIFAHMEEPSYNELDDFNFNIILLDHYLGNGTTSFIHKSALDEYGYFDESIGFAEDYELWLRFCFLYGCRLILVKKTIAKYRIHQGQTTKTKLRNGNEYRNRLKESILEKLHVSERKNYEIELAKYRKNKPILEKMKFFVRYSLFSILPSFFSNKILNAYWYARKRKILE